MDVGSTLRMMDHGALTRDGIQFNTQQGILWMNEAFQTRIEEMETELRTMVNPVARGSSAGRVISHVPRPLANRLGTLATEANLVQTTTSFDVRERLGTAPAPRDQSLESRFGTERRPTTECGSPGNCRPCSPTY